MKPDETTSCQYQLVNSLFEDVYELNEVDREAHFKSLRHLDLSVIASVRELLKLAAETGPLSRPAFELIGNEGEELKEGDILNVYTIIKKINSGGMGVVYLAERTDGLYQRKVAIKVVRPGKVLFGYVEQFTREISLLASLEHPRLCRLYNSGITPGNYPYMVMEYIDGHDFDVIDQWPKNNVLSFFQMICNGVGHAHTRQIVHGDLKPENIMVRRDKTPVVMDFGISAFSGEEAARHMTLNYASPEQIEGGALTTLSDIYSLGVIFLESTKRFADDELKAIGRKATAKNPEDRYSSFNEFRDDIQNVLNYLPVHAIDPTPAYLTSKFIVRNRKLVTSAIISLAVVISIIVFFLHNLNVARANAQQEAEVANTLLDFQQSMLYGSTYSADYLSDVGGFGGLFEDTLIMDKFVFEVAKQAKTQLADNPEALIRMITVAGGVLSNMQSFTEADSVFDMAPPLEEVSVYSQGRLFRYLSAHKINLSEGYKAVELADSSVKLFEDEYGLNHLETVRSVLRLAHANTHSGEYGVADSLYTIANPLLVNLKGGVIDTEVILYNFEYGELLNDMERFEEADSLFLSLYPHLDESFQDYNALYMGLLEFHATTYYFAGNYAKALELLEEALELKILRLGENNQEVASSRNNLAVLYTYLEKEEEAVRLFEYVLEFLEGTEPQNPMLVSRALINLSSLNMITGNYVDALYYSEELFLMKDQMLQSDSMMYGVVLERASVAAAANGQYDRAIRLSEESAPYLATALTKDDRRYRIHTRGKAIGLLMKGEYEQAKELSIEALVDSEEYRPHFKMTYEVILWASYNGLGETQLADSVATVVQNQYEEEEGVRVFTFLEELVGLTRPD